MSILSTSEARKSWPSVADGPPKAGCCRFCGTPLESTFVDLGMSPLCESYVSAESANLMEPFYPLHVWVRRSCLLVQPEEYVSGEDIFTEYAYFSSYSDSWLDHCRRYVEQVIDELGLTRATERSSVGVNRPLCVMVRRMLSSRSWDRC